MGCDDLQILLKEWETSSDIEEFPPVIEELQMVEQRHREVLQVSDDLEEAFHQILRKVQ